MELVKTTLVLDEDENAKVLFVFEDDQGTRWETVSGAIKIEEDKDE